MGKAAVDAARAEGSWAHSWALTGLPEPDIPIRSLTMPTEAVAMTALAKEKKILEQARDEAIKAKKGGDGK